MLSRCLPTSPMIFEVSEQRGSAEIQTSRGKVLRAEIGDEGREGHEPITIPVGSKVCNFTSPSAHRKITGWIGRNLGIHESDLNCVSEDTYLEAACRFTVQNYGPVACIVLLFKGRRLAYINEGAVRQMEACA